jgi:hypothetical protein
MYLRRMLVSLFLLFALAAAQQDTKPPAATSEPQAPDYSGMYTFLQDGEFVQITVEDQGRVTGFVSRYGDIESDKGVFLDQFFKQGKLENQHLSFTTETVHGVWFDFKGDVGRGTGKDVNEEGYYILKGSLTQNVTDAQKKVNARAREVTFKSFPRDSGPPSAKKSD